METYNIEQDISVFYVQAETFPQGVGAAWQKLHSLFPPGSIGRFYGISYGGPGGTIIYRAAAAESFPGEGSQKGCETFLIKKGPYISEFITDWKKDETIIGKTFQRLLHQPGIDPAGYCLEIYENASDVRCLVSLA
jgi:hypothetical protein